MIAMQDRPSDDPVVPAPARLTVYRASAADARQRQVILTLDDNPLATLLYGQQVTREIPPGRHQLRANNTLVWKTLSFDAVPGQDLHFHIVNRAGRGMMWMVALFGAGPMFVSIEPASGPPAPQSAA